MVNWEDEMKKALAKKLKEILGEDISIENIYTIEMPFEESLEDLDVESLARIYAFSIMKEDFEQTKLVAEELNKRNCKINVDVDDIKKTGIIDVTYQPQNEVKHIEVCMKLTKDGMMIDFDKELPI